MATKKKAVKDDSDKAVDLPPAGPRNADPLTDAPDTHPIETGIGAGLAGAAAGLAVGALGGPVGATVRGAVAGGLAGKGVGEGSDRTTENAWLHEYFGLRAERRRGESHERYRDAYRYGRSSAAWYGNRRFEDVEPDLQTEWQTTRGSSTMGWDDARDAVRHAYDRHALKRIADAGAVTVADERIATPGDPPATSRIEDLRV
jgi:hypothetical protein